MTDIHGLAAELVAALDPAAEIEYRRALWREAFALGLAIGDRRGYRRARAEQTAAWHAIADPAAYGGPAHAELERRRWGPGGREHFADEQPDDYPGRRTAA